MALGSHSIARVPANLRGPRTVKGPKQLSGPRSTHITSDELTNPGQLKRLLRQSMGPIWVSHFTLNNYIKLYIDVRCRGPRKKSRGHFSPTPHVSTPMNDGEKRLFTLEFISGRRISLFPHYEWIKYSLF